MIRYIRLLILLILLTGAALLLFQSYHPGIPVDELKGTYLYPDSEFMEVNGLDVHIRKIGDGTPLLLLHGVASSLHTWEGWQSDLSGDYQTISIDVPGFGLTGGFPDGKYSVEAYMQFLDELLDKLQIDTCYMAGNSFGGYLTWNYAARYPDRVKKIILLDAAGYPKKLTEEDLGFLLSRLKATAWFTHLFTPVSLVRRSVRNAYKHDEKITKNTVERYYYMLVRKGNRQNLSEVLRIIPLQTGNRARLQQLQQPTLIMWGDGDRIISVHNAEKFHDDIPNSKLIWYDSGHVPMEEVPVRTARDAREFLLQK